MTDELPAPLLPPEVDLREFEWMPLMVRRYRDSTLIATRNGDDIVAATLLWSASWHQVPAASLPNNDMELASLAGFGRAVKEFNRHREGAMHGLELCSDGRFWHPVVAEKAADAWNGKRLDAWRRACDLGRKVNRERAERKEEPLPMPARPAMLIRKNSERMTPWFYENPDDVPPEFQRGPPRNSAAIGRRRSKGEGDGDLKSKSGAPPDPDARPPNGKVNGRHREGSGTRLDSAWRIPDELVDWTIAAYPELDRARVIRMSLEFRDYWTAVPGQRGRKADWVATWRNNVRRKMDDA